MKLKNVYKYRNNKYKHVFAVFIKVSIKCEFKETSPIQKVFSPPPPLILKLKQMYLKCK